MKITVTFEVPDEELRVIANSATGQRRATRQEVKDFILDAYTSCYSDAQEQYDLDHEGDKR